jgi:hypothetical protein
VSWTGECPNFYNETLLRSLNSNVNSLTENDPQMTKPVVARDINRKVKKLTVSRNT